MMAWSPLAQGFLTGKITRENLKDGDHRLATFDFLPYDKEKGFALVDQLQTIAKGKGCSAAQIAIAWLLAKPEATSVTIGASKMTQLEDSLGAVDVELSADELATLDAAMPPPRVYPNWFTEATADQAHTQALSEDTAD